jgi:cysteine desulfurase/selenocysteine lyase
MLDIQKIKKDFPIFGVHPELVYLDSTATSLKPKSVIDKTIEYYKDYSSNIHRGVYQIAEKASEEYEETREITAKFINCTSSNEIIFTRGTTESINLVAYTWGEERIESGDEIVVTIDAHHANFVPWQQLAKKKGAKLVLSEDDKTIIKCINPKTKLLALTHISNVTGEIHRIKEIIQEVRQKNSHIVILVDGAQAVPHMKVDMKDMDCDFYAFSSHKMLGPTGVGVLFGKEALLNSMKPFNYGGDMIEAVAIEQSSFKNAPYRFEAGTPDIAGIIAFKKAIQYLESVGMENIHEHEKALVDYCFERFDSVFGKDVSIMNGQDRQRAAIFSFTLGSVHAHDVAQILDESYIAVRAGHHCAMPLHTKLCVPASARASFYIYNDKNDVDALIEGLKNVKKIFG